MLTILPFSFQEKFTNDRLCFLTKRLTNISLYKKSHFWEEKKLINHYYKNCKTYQTKSNTLIFSEKVIEAEEPEGTNIVSILRAKYGDCLSRDQINSLDRTTLNNADKETLRKLKISIANKGRKPWNIGRKHNSDTVRRIREKTRQAMCRADVRERWAARWLPKAHTEETKRKLRSIMLEKEQIKKGKMNVWLKKEMGIDVAVYKNLSTKTREAYRRAFYTTWRVAFIKNVDIRKNLSLSLIGAKQHILKVSEHEVEKHRCFDRQGRILISKVGRKQSSSRTKQSKNSNTMIANQKKIRIKTKPETNNRDTIPPRHNRMPERRRNSTLLSTLYVRQHKDKTIEHTLELYEKALPLYRNAIDQYILIESSFFTTSKKKWKKKKRNCIL